MPPGHNREEVTMTFLCRPTTLLLACLTLTGCGGQRPESTVAATKWPDVKEQKTEVKFRNDKPEKINIHILSKDGKLAYELIGQFQPWKFEGESSDIGDYNYSGIFDCRLLPVPREVGVSSLFFYSEKATKDWETVGRFTQGQISAIPKEIPGRSIVQVCNLRGMSIKLSINNVQASSADGSIHGFDLTVEVEPDRGAENPRIWK